MDFAVYYENQRKLVENFLKTRIAKKGISKVDEAMEYSLMAGGKRRTIHLVFGVAMAVLAGDGLLTLAFEVMLEQKNVEPAALIETVREMAMCAGNFGMVGGQGLDIEFEGKDITPEQLRKLHAGKTGALFIAAIRGGAHLAVANHEQLLALTKFSALFG